MDEKKKLLEQLVHSMSVLDDKQVLASVRQLSALGCPNAQMQDALNRGMKEVGDKFERGEYFFADLLVSGLVYREALALLLPQDGAGEEDAQPAPSVLFGVVQDDIHDIGKDIVVSLLRSEGIGVLDLGVDVSPKMFLEKIRKERPRVLLLSGMLKISQSMMEETVAEIERAGLREGLYIVAGGGCVDDYVRAHLGADAFASEPSETLEICKRCLKQ